MKIIIGMTLISIGFCFRFLAALGLGRNLNWRIVIPDKIVKTGIYKYIRHPMYFGSLFDYTGLCLILTTYGTAIIFISLLINLVLDRIDREERLLLSEYGFEYLEYMQNTKAIIPFIL